MGGSGLWAQLGIAPEVTYGTYVAPTRFTEFNKEGLALKKTTAQSSGIAAGRFLPLAARRVLVQQEAAGSVDMEVTNKGMGLWIQGLMGTSVTPVQQGATAAYLQTHTLADSFGKSLTIQKGVPLTTGVITDKTFVGCKIMSGEFSCEAGNLLMASFDIDAKDCVETEALAVASYPSMSPFGFHQMAVKTGAFGAEVARDGIRKASVKFERPQAVDRFYANQAGRKKEPIANDQVKITGSLDTDYVDTILDDLNTSDGTTSLVWEFVGPLIASTFYETFRITLPAIKFDEGPPQVDGFDVVKPQMQFSGLYDGTNQPKIEIISTDVTL